MNSSIKNLVIVFFALILVGALGFSFIEKNNQANQSTQKSNVISGIVTSEKETFLNSHELQELAKKNGFIINIKKMTSDQITSLKKKEDLGGNDDFIFPSSNQVSDYIKNTFTDSQSQTILYSPMVIATRTPIVQLLKSNNFLIDKGSYQALDMNKMLTIMSQKVKWNSLKNNTEYLVNKNILISTSDARRSGSSKMFLGLASYIFNNNEVIENDQQLNSVVPKIKELMQAQGYRESSSADLFNDYVSIGMGKTPMIFVYESQMIELAVKNHGLKDNMQILYPVPTLFSKHTYVALNSKGREFMNFLANNDEVKTIAASYGFRITGGNQLQDVANNIKLIIPMNLVDTIDLPTLEIQDKLVTQVENN